MSAGGKTFGVLKAQQRDRLEEINKVGYSSTAILCVYPYHIVPPVFSYWCLVLTLMQFSTLGLELVDINPLIL